MNAALLVIVLLGIFHGINPGMGWLFGVYNAIFKKQTIQLPITISLIAVGHIISVVPIILLFLIVTSLSFFVSLIVGLVLIGFGCFRLVNHYKHPRTTLKMGYPRMITWGILLGLSHGSGVSLLPFFHSTDAFFLLAAHFTATVGMMLVMATITYYVFDVSILKKIWINFDLLWGLILITIGTGVVAQFLIDFANIGITAVVAFIAIVVGIIYLATRLQGRKEKQRLTLKVGKTLEKEGPA